MDDSGNLLKQYPYVTSQDVDYLREGYGALGDITQLVRCINTARETQQANGREHVLAGPLLDVQSVHVLPKPALKGRPVFVYGRIRVNYLHISDGRQMHLDIYNRSADDAEYISPTGGNLTLTWPDDNNQKVYDLWMKLDKTTIAADLYLKIGNRTAPLAVDDILVGDTTEGDFEEVKSKVIGGKLCSATVVYIAMPFATLGRLGIHFSSKDRNIHQVNVAGKISARYKNTYGNYDSEEWTLFESKDEFEPVNLKMNKFLRLSRYWLGKPAYSSLILDLDLRDFDANTTLIKRKVELFDRNGVFSTEYLVTVDGLTIDVHMPMFSYQPDGCCYESSDSDESDDECVFEDNLRYHHHSMPVTPCASNLVEFYSVLIGRRNLMALNVSGTIEITTDHNSQYLFKSIGDDVVKMEEGDKVCGPKGKSTPSASVPPPFTKGTPPPPERKPVLRQSNPFSTVLRDYNHQRVDKGFHQEGKSLSVFVKNLPTTVSIQDIVREFQNFGTIKQGGVVLRKGKDVGICYAVVEFEDVQGVCNALKVSPIKLNGRQVHIQERRQVNKNNTSRGREGAGRAGGRGRSFGMGAYQHNPVVMTG
ncbi:unnamed protein product [Cuscuta campestris]|uniref:RRM domain-containing protein n=1 Tax=Cuscuta campestris TaxID=132261 RepID=A0A484MYA5_9ASTE|nr:unnamed protein product [Cuscuta campestris]